MAVKSKSRRRKNIRDLVVDISGTGFAGPEQHATAVSAWEPPCDEKEKRSIVGSVVNALLKPCCGSDATAKRSKTKVKRIKHYATSSKDCKPNFASPKVNQPSSSQCVDSASRPGPSNPLIQADSGYVSGSLLFPLKQTDDDNISVIGLGDLSERAQAEQASRRPADSSLSDLIPCSSSEQTNIPGAPDYLTALPSNKVKLPPIQPLYLSKAMKNMQRALAKVEEEEEIPPIVPIRLELHVQKPQPLALSKHQKELQDKLVAQFTKHAAQSERQAMKAKLADKKKAIQKEFEKVNHLKKRAKIDKRLEKVWEREDEELSNKLKTREQTLKENDATIEKHSAVIQRLKKEIELLKGKQECKLMRHELVCNKGCKSILSETVKQCEATKLRRRYFSLGREIDKLWDEVYSRQHKVQELIPNSSSSVAEINAEFDVQWEDNTSPPPKSILVGSENEQANVGMSDPQVSNEDEETSAIEEDPFVRYGFAPPVHKRKPENAALIALFIGESARKSQQSEKECLEKFQESCAMEKSSNN